MNHGVYDSIFCLCHSQWHPTVIGVMYQKDSAKCHSSWRKSPLEKSFYIFAKISNSNSCHFLSPKHMHNLICISIPHFVFFCEFPTLKKAQQCKIKSLLSMIMEKQTDRQTARFAHLYRTSSEYISHFAKPATMMKMMLFYMTRALAGPNVRLRVTTFALN